MTDAPTKYYLRQHQQNRLFDTVVEALEKSGVRKKAIAEKLDVHPSQVTRWLSGPGNWESDTISDLLFSIDAEMDFLVVSFAERNQKKKNRFHPLGIERPAPTLVRPPASGTTTSVVTTSCVLAPGIQTVAISTSTPQPKVALENA